MTAEQTQTGDAPPMRTARRPRLIHYHIFKNAGSSVDAGLAQSFAERWGTFEGAHARDVQSSANLSRFLDQHPALLAVSSHLARPPLPDPADRAIVFLRHPLLRARSVHRFTQQDPAQPDHALADTLDFSGYVDWALSGGSGGVVIRNYQVIHLSDASFRGQSILDAEALQSDLQSAQSLLGGWGYAGLVEDYEASAVHYESQYRADFPGLILADQWHNKTSSQSVDQALQAAEAELGPARLSRFEQANALDYALWSWARDRFHR